MVCQCIFDKYYHSDWLPFLLALVDVGICPWTKTYKICIMSQLIGSWAIYDSTIGSGFWACLILFTNKIKGQNFHQKLVKDCRINGRKKICLAVFLRPPSAHHCAGSHFRREFATILLMGKWPGWIRAWRCSLCQLVGQSVHWFVHPSHSPTCHDPKGMLEEVVNCFRCS